MVVASFRDPPDERIVTDCAGKPSHVPEPHDEVYKSERANVLSCQPAMAIAQGRDGTNDSSSFNDCWLVGSVVE